jgi:hypothetical protein
MEPLNCLTPGLGRRSWFHKTPAVFKPFWLKKKLVAEEVGCHFGSRTAVFKDNRIQDSISQIHKRPNQKWKAARAKSGSQSKNTD